VKKSPPPDSRRIVGLVIDPRTTDPADADAPGVVRLLETEASDEQCYSHALRLLREAEKGGPS
jgi:hypothetical protein